jgi:hypothetical protein
MPALAAVDGRHVDDPAPAPVHHAVVHLLRHVEDGIEVGLHDRIPIGLAHLAKGHVLGDARVVDEDVDGTNLSSHLFYAGLARLEVRHIAGVGFEIVALLLHVGQPFGRCLVRRRVCDSDAISCVSHFRADRFAEAAHAARNNRNAFAHVLLSRYPAVVEVRSIIDVSQRRVI